MAIFATQYTKTYHDGTTKPTVAWPYIAFAINLSQVMALYCLVLMYHVRFFCSSPHRADLEKQPPLLPLWRRSTLC